MTILIFFVILLVLVLVHEAGHFFAAKISKMRVDEFAFGFPPRIFSKKVGETEYSFNLLPLGGYVKIYGENGLDEENGNRSFSSRPKILQLFVLVAGVLMNIVLAYFLLAATFMVGTEMAHSNFTNKKYFSNEKIVVSQVLSDSPAAKAGISQLDQIKYLSASGEAVTPMKPEDVSLFVQKFQNESIKINIIDRGGLEKEIVVSPEILPGDNRKIIGISTDMIGLYKAPALEAFKNSFFATYEYTKLTFIGFAKLISQLFSGNAKEAGEALTGPVGIVSLVGDAKTNGLGALLGFTALISINLAVLNILPLPALDGGRIVFVLIEAVRGRRLSENFQALTNGISFILLILLMLFVTYKDIIKIW